VTSTFLLLLFAGVASAQVQPANPGFEQGELAGNLTAGLRRPHLYKDAFAVQLVDQGCCRTPPSTRTWSRTPGRRRPIAIFEAALVLKVT
jgi:hypothetical protein